MFGERTVTVDGGSMDLPTISHWKAPETMTVTFNPSEGLRTLVVDHRFYKIFSLTIDPRPMVTVAMTGRTGYEFPADPYAKLAVVLRLQTQRPLFHEFDIGIGDDVVNRSVFVFP